MKNNDNKLRDFIAFKLAQANRLKKQPLTGDEFKAWVAKQVECKTELLVSILREAIAANVA